MTCERFLTFGAVSSVSRPTRGPKDSVERPRCRSSRPATSGFSRSVTRSSSGRAWNLRLPLEHLPQVAQPLGVPLGDVARLAPVLGVVVQLPDVLVERPPGGRPTISQGTPWRVTAVQPSWYTPRLPIISKYCVRVPVRGLGLVERVVEAGALNRLLGDASEGLGHVEPGRPPGSSAARR